MGGYEFFRYGCYKLQPVADSTVLKGVRYLVIVARRECRSVSARYRRRLVERFGRKGFCSAAQRACEPCVCLDGRATTRSGTEHSYNTSIYPHITDTQFRQRAVARGPLQSEYVDISIILWATRAQYATPRRGRHGCSRASLSRWPCCRATASPAPARTAAAAARAFGAASTHTPKGSIRCAFSDDQGQGCSPCCSQGPFPGARCFRSISSSRLSRLSRQVNSTSGRRLRYTRSRRPGCCSTLSRGR